jgi:hypothetical protein
MKSAEKGGEAYGMSSQFRAQKTIAEKKIPVIYLADLTDQILVLATLTF